MQYRLLRFVPISSQTYNPIYLDLLPKLEVFENISFMTGFNVKSQLKQNQQIKCKIILPNDYCQMNIIP